MTTLNRTLVPALVLFAILNGATTLPATETETNTDQWEVSGEVYLWGASIGGDDVAGNVIDIPFKNLWDNLDLAFMGKIGARKGKFMLFGDFIYLDVEDDTSGLVNINGLPTYANAGVELTTFINTLGGGYTVYDSSSVRLNMLLGVRYLYLNVDVKLDAENDYTKLSDSDDVIDGIVGLFGGVDITEKWYFSCYADIGTGESKTTWQINTLVGYRFDKFDAVVGYRYLEYQFDDAVAIDNLNVSGPFTGVRIDF